METFASDPADRIAFGPAGPDVERGELAGQDVGQALHGEALAGVMAGQDQADPRRLRLQIRVVASLEEQNCVVM